MKKQNIFLLGVLVFVFSLVGVYVMAQGEVSHKAEEIEAGEFGKDSGGGDYTFPRDIKITRDIKINKGGIGYADSVESSYIWMDDKDGNRRVQIRSYAIDGVQAFFNAGNVGIGTTSPKARLHVSGSTFLPSGQSYWIGQTSDSGNRLRMHLAGDHAYIDYYNNLYFRSGQSSSANKMTLTSGGNVSIAGGLTVNNYVYTYGSILYLRGPGGNTDDTAALHSRYVYTTLIQNNAHGGNITISPQGASGNPGNVYFRGASNADNVSIHAKNVYKTYSNFLIDHPTKKGMKLVHSGIEGPEAAVYYRGETKLRNGKIVVELPEYFEALTRTEERTVQLTCKNGFSALYIDGEIKNGKFTVKTNSRNLNQEFYWEVKAVRADGPPLKVERKASDF